MDAVKNTHSEETLFDRFGNPVPDWHKNYFRAIGDNDFLVVLADQFKQTPLFMAGINPALEDYAYADGKWTLKEVLLHMIDCERIMSYRALSFARNESANLPGFEENEYVPFSDASNRTMGSIIDEYKAVRNSTIHLFKNFTLEMRARKGTANGLVCSVELLGIIMAGHEAHHLKIINERYLS